MTKVNEQRDNEIRRKKAEGATYKELLEQYPISLSRLKQVLNPEAEKAQRARKLAKVGCV